MNPREMDFDSKYGRQFKVYTYEEKLPATIAGLERYLGSGLIKGIGPVMPNELSKIQGRYAKNN